MFKQHSRAGRTAPSNNTNLCRGACITLNPDSNRANPLRFYNLFYQFSLFIYLLNFFNGNCPYVILGVLDLSCISFVASFCDRSLQKYKTGDQYLKNMNVLRKRTHEQQL